MFKVFGEIKEVIVEPSQGFALVAFQDIVSAFFAQQSLNNYYLSKYNANLHVKWMNNNQSTSPLAYSSADKADFTSSQSQVVNQENQN